MIVQYYSAILQVNDTADVSLLPVLFNDFLVQLNGFSLSEIAGVYFSPQFLNTSCKKEKLNCCLY